MKRAVVAACVVWATAMAPPAVGQTPTQDSVTGTALACRQPPDGCMSLPPGQSGTWVRLTADARSGPNGEGPAGTMTWDERFEGGFSHGDTTVSCLSVKHNVAVVGVSGTLTMTIISGTFDVPVSGLIRITDGGVAADTVEFDTAQGMPGSPPQPGPTTCSAFPSGLEADVADDGGDIVVTDGQPPTTYAQCRQAGWVAYGYASHAQCIDAVHQRAREKCIFERAAHGITAFRAKYGLDANGDHAMRHCVRLYTGF